MNNSFLPAVCRAAQMGIALAAIATLTSCATSGSSASRSSHVLKTRNSAHGEIASLRSLESGSKLYVTGSLRRASGYTIPHGAHIDIELIDQSGRVVASQQDRIASAHPKKDNRRGGRYSFAASFPIEAAKTSERIRVVYHVDSRP